MARAKVTVTLDKEKAELARSLVGATSTSGVIDVALDRLVRAELRRADAAAYRAQPTTAAEVGIAGLGDNRALADDTDWEALYADFDG